MEESHVICFPTCLFSFFSSCCQINLNCHNRQFSFAIFLPIKPRGLLLLPLPIYTKSNTYFSSNQQPWEGASRSISPLTTLASRTSRRSSRSLPRPEIGRSIIVLETFSLPWSFFFLPYLIFSFFRPVFMYIYLCQISLNLL